MLVVYDQDRLFIRDVLENINNCDEYEDIDQFRKALNKLRSLTIGGGAVLCI